VVGRSDFPAILVVGDENGCSSHGLGSSKEVATADCQWL